MTPPRSEDPPLAPSSADASPQSILCSPNCQLFKVPHRCSCKQPELLGFGHFARPPLPGPQGPSRGSPSFEGLQTLLHPMTSVKTHRNLLYRIRYVRQICICLERLLRVVISRPQPDYLITAPGYCQPLADAGRIRSWRLLPGRFARCSSFPRTVLRSPEILPYAYADVKGCSGAMFARARKRLGPGLSIIPARILAIACGEYHHYEAGHRHHHDALR